MAEWFFDHLGPHGRFAGAFAQVVFAVLDRTDSGEIIEPFTQRFLSDNP